MTTKLGDRLSEIMQAPARTIQPSATLRQLAAELAADLVGLLVVIGPDGHAIGVASERDLVRAVAEDEDLDVARVADVMTDRLIWAAPDMPLRDAAALMAAAEVRHLVVLAGGWAVGVVSARDVTAAVGQPD